MVLAAASRDTLQGQQQTPPMACVASKQQPVGAMSSNIAGVTITPMFLATRAAADDKHM